MKGLWEDIINSFKIVLVLCLVCYAIIFIIHGNLRWENIEGITTYNFYYGIPLSIINGRFFDNLDRFMPWHTKPKQRALFGFFGSIVITMITVVALNFILWVCIWDNNVSVLFSERNRGFYLVALGITIVISLVLHSVGFFKEIQEERLKSETLRKEQIASELNALKAHVDPHFLFNSFNVLSGLIEEDAEKAQDFLAGLSKIYRHILEKRDEDISPLKEELRFAMAYLSLHQMRFENAIIIEENIPSEFLERDIPSLSLQLLLENAIKHNAFDSNTPLKIELGIEEDCLVVRNNLNKRQVLSDSNGMGLQNIISRYALMEQKDVRVVEGQDTFSVHLPLLS